eukprot:1156722-Pelagomonas_calceolata.AAC.13
MVRGHGGSGCHAVQCSDNKRAMSVFTGKLGAAGNIEAKRINHHHEIDPLSNHHQPLSAHHHEIDPLSNHHQPSSGSAHREGGRVQYSAVLGHEEGTVGIQRANLLVLGSRCCQEGMSQSAP